MCGNSFLSAEDRAILAKGRFQKRMGFGARPAILAIDMQRYMIGEDGRDAEWPSSCGEAGRAAAEVAERLATKAKAAGIPCFFTRIEVDPSGIDIGIYGRKRDLLSSPNWMLRGTRGAELLDTLRPGANDHVIVKKKPSAFHGTPLLGLLIERGIDTVIIMGGATSNCVRATVFDASSYNFHTIVVEEAVFDRIPISHAIGLFDMDRQFADVVRAAEVLTYLDGIGAATGTDG